MSNQPNFILQQGLWIEAKQETSFILSLVRSSVAFHFMQQDVN